MNIPKSITDAATKTTILKRKIAALSTELEEAKDIIRSWAIEAYAVAQKGNPELTMLEVPTKEGTLSVIFPRDKPAFIKGTEPEMLFQTLPPMKSNLVVEHEVCIVKGFYESWTSPSSPFTKAEQKLIAKVIEFKEQTPRIEPAK